MRFLLLFLAFLGLAVPAYAGETVTYKDGNTTLEGYIARPAGDKETPVVMIVHQWMGLTDYEKMRADMLATEGYTAFAVDIYGQGVRPKNKDEAGTMAGQYKNDYKLARQRMQAALDYARTIPNTTGKIAVIGYCFGGTMALELARSGADVDGVISFHGGLATKDPAEKGDIKEPLQIHHGAAEIIVKPPEVEAFKKEMAEAEVRVEFHSYPGAVHAFTQKDAGTDVASGVAYNADADKLSWIRALEFLRKVLK